MLDPNTLYVAALQNALRAVPDHRVTIDLKAAYETTGLLWPDDGLHLLLETKDGVLTAALYDADTAERKQADMMRDAAFMARGPNGERFILTRPEDDGPGDQVQGDREGNRILGAFRTARKARAKKGRR